MNKQINSYLGTIIQIYLNNCIFLRSLKTKERDKSETDEFQGRMKKKKKKRKRSKSLSIPADHEIGKIFKGKY